MPSQPLMTAPPLATIDRTLFSRILDFFFPFRMEDTDDADGVEPSKFLMIYIDPLNLRHPCLKLIQRFNVHQDCVEFGAVIVIKVFARRT